MLDFLIRQAVILGTGVPEYFKYFRYFPLFLLGVVISVTDELEDAMLMKLKKTITYLTSFAPMHTQN